jgi:hypothetical protein
MATTLTPNNPPRGNFTQVERVTLPFKVKDVKELGSNQGKKRHWVKVEFDNGRVLTIKTESKSLTDAFEMIAAMGLEINPLTDKEYQKFVNSHRGKRMWFSMNGDSEEVIVSVYKRNRHGNALKSVFGQPITLDNGIPAEAKRVAKLHKMKPVVNRKKKGPKAGPRLHVNIQKK